MPGLTQYYYYVDDGEEPILIEVEEPPVVITFDGDPITHEEVRGGQRRRGKRKSKESIQVARPPVNESEALLVTVLQLPPKEEKYGW